MESEDGSFSLGHRQDATVLSAFWQGRTYTWLPRCLWLNLFVLFSVVDFLLKKSERLFLLQTQPHEFWVAKAQTLLLAWMGLGLCWKPPVCSAYLRSTIWVACHCDEVCGHIVWWEGCGRDTCPNMCSTVALTAWLYLWFAFKAIIAVWSY